MNTFALPPSRVARFESALPIGLESVLGSSATWVERATDACGSGPLVHERVAGGGLAFRPIRSGATHALVAQLVHVDTSGAPHITGLIDSVELRVGRDSDATACVLGVDEGSLAGGAPRLRTKSIDELPRTVFMRRAGDGQLGCVSCHEDHQAQGARDLLDPAERAEIMGARERLLNRLRAPPGGSGCSSSAVSASPCRSSRCRRGSRPRSRSARLRRPRHPSPARRR